MIQQKGHSKSLDIWNLGILFFELLCGKPPFEGKNQQQLFESILKFKIKWPKGFDPVATDLVKKLLKIDPAERLSLEAMLEHPFFEKNEPLRPITASVIGKKIDP